MNARREVNRLHDQADAKLREVAREDLIDRLAALQTIGHFRSRDVFDEAMNTDIEYDELLDLLDAVLALNGKAGDDHRLAAHEVAARAKAFMERFVDGMPDLIQERAYELANDNEENR